MKRRQDEEQMRQQDIIEKQKAEQDRGRYAQKKTLFPILLNYKYRRFKDVLQ